uniref:Uncharacterized protein n=1 Tax=Caenorhabditis japonica TaxID=281687 RepID=A0A8R1EIG6_CAEJA
MQHAMEKIRGHKKPKVSVRVNVRPLRSNWKPVKIVEVGGQASSSPTKMSPAQEPLNANIWKNVRTDYVLDSKSSDEKSSELQTPSESTESSQNTTNSTFMPNSESQKVLVKEEEEKIPGLVKMCECENCRLLDATPTCVSPKRSDKMELLRERCKKKMMKGKMLEKREKKRKLARKNEKHR